KTKPRPSSLAWKGLCVCAVVKSELMLPAAATTATTAAAATVFSWSSFVDGESSSVRFFTVEGIDRLLCFGAAAHLDKAEAFRAVCLTVHDDLSGLNRPMRRKHVFQIGVRHTIRQVSDIQLRSHVGPPSENITQQLDPQRANTVT